MQESENKNQTATEKAMKLRERRRKGVEQAGKNTEEEPGKPALQLGIDKLKKSRNGMIILVVGFLLLAVGFSVYYIPSIIRSGSSGAGNPPRRPPSTATTNH